MTYNYLATLRLHDNPDGRALTVGPGRRVVFRQGMSRTATKEGVKAALRPLEGLWSSPDNAFASPASPPVPGNQPRMMSYQRFRGEAKRLLVNAGLLTLTRREVDEENHVPHH